MSEGRARDPYIHGTAPSEQERLAALNRMTNKAFVEFLRSIGTGQRGSAVGYRTSSVISRVLSQVLWNQDCVMMPNSQKRSMN
jgi:hypothetical protein